MTQIFEVVMLVCFGLSWPISVYKSIKTKSTKGKSLIFIIAIIIGYVSGIVGKIINGQFTYVLIIYCINLIVVSVDLILYFINRKNEKKEKTKVSFTPTATGTSCENLNLTTTCINK